MEDYRRADWRPKVNPVTLCDTRHLCKLTDHTGDVVWVDPQTTKRGNTVDYVRGIHHFGFGRTSRALAKTVDSTMDRLGMRGWDSADYISSGLTDFLTAFFHGCRESLKLVIFENSRELFSVRCEGFAEQGAQIQTKPSVRPRIIDKFNRPYSSHDTKTVSIVGCPLNQGLVQFQLPADTRRSGAMLRQSGNRRTVIQDDHERTLGRWQIYMLSRPILDDQTLLEGRLTPEPPVLFDNELNLSKLLTWMKVDLATMTTQSVCFDFNSYTEKLSSVRYVEMSFEDYCFMDPRVGRWLTEAVLFSMYSITNAQLFADNAPYN